MTAISPNAPRASRRARARSFDFERNKRPIIIGALALLVLLFVAIIFMLLPRHQAPAPHASMAVTAQRGDDLTRIAAAHNVSVRSMGVLNFHSMIGAFPSTCASVTQATGDFCNARLELAQLSTIRPGQVIRVPTPPPGMFARVRSWGTAPMTIVVDMRSARAAEAAAAYIAQSDMAGRHDNVWLFGGGSVQRYETRGMDPSLPVMGLQNAVNIAVSSDGTNNVFVVADRDVSVNSGQALPRDVTLMTHCVGPQGCSHLGDGARRNYTTF